jgi:hypothetical protein
LRIEKKLSWQRVRATKRIKVARISDNEETRRYYGHTHTLEKNFADMDGDFVVEIDIDGIVRRLVGTAAHNASGKSTALSGMVKAKRIKERVVSERTETYPISDGYSEVKEVKA